MPGPHTNRIDNRYRCNGCGQSWHKVRAGPVLHDDVWLSIADERDILCDDCVRSRIEQVHGRPLRFEDLRCCEFNLYGETSYFEELVSPEMLKAMKDGG